MTKSISEGKDSKVSTISNQSGQSLESLTKSLTGLRKHTRSHKYNLRHELDDYTKNNRGANFVTRNPIFYCTHMNRKNTFFQKHQLLG